MSNYSQRLSKLEPGPQHNEYLREVGLRLLRYVIETHNQVQTGKLPAKYWYPEQEEMYQQWKKDDPSFDALEREVLANPIDFQSQAAAQDGEKIERPTDA